jgi:Mrp family chromosome partitioning ATPase
MGRIEQARRRLENLQAVDYDASLINIDEYPKERGAKESVTRVDAVAPSAATSRQSSDDDDIAVTVIASSTSEVAEPRLTAVQAPEGSASSVEGARNAFVPDADSSPLQQRCRRVAGQLRDLQAQRELKTVMVTSADESNGKTRAALNLALALANQSRHPVLLIDADIRRPLVHELARCVNDMGLADVLRGGNGVPLHRLTPLVHVLPAGSPIPHIPDLASERMSTLLGQCAARYEWVIVDAPTDSPFTLGTLVHGAVFVINSSTPFPVVERAMTQLGADRVVATILIGLEDAKPAQG